MKNKSLIFMLFILAQGTSTSYAQESTENYIISSGSNGGNYYKTGIVISELLNEINEYTLFTTVVSTGSIDNISKLKIRFADFAIVQRDVLLNNFYSNESGIKNITLLMPLFQEKFIIYTHSDSPIPFESFKQTVNNSSNYLKIGVTSKNGTTYKTFVSISGLLGINMNNISFIVEDYSILIKKFKNSEIDYFITFSLPIEELEYRKQISVVYFNKKQILLLKSRMRQLSESSFDNINHKTLGIWSLLIGLDSSIKKIGEHEILNHLQKIIQRDDFISIEIQKTLKGFKQNKNWRYKYLANIPVSPYLLKTLGYQTNIFQKIFPFIATVLLIIFCFLIFSKSNLVRRLGWTYFWTRYKHIYIGVIIIIVLYIACIEIIVFSENQLFLKTTIKSQVLDMTRPDIHFWNAVRIFTNNEGGVFPLSSLGKAMVSASAYTIWFGGLLIVFLEFFMYKLIIKRKKGLMKITHKNHIIIAGWNEFTSQFIEELLLACKNFYNKKIKIVCIAPNPEGITKNNDYINNLEQKKVISFVDGYIRHKTTLEQSNANLAKTIVLLADDGTIQSDEKTLLRALSISKFCKEQSSSATSNRSSKQIGKYFETKNNINTVYIIAQVNNDEFVEDLRNAGVNGIINKTSIIDGILIQSILNPGVSKLINNILSFSDDTNEFYTVDLLRSENTHLRNKTFDELLLPLRKQNILLVAIRIIYRGKNGDEIVDEDEILQKLNKDGLTRQIITNPITKAETNRKTDYDDHLLVLSVGGKELKTGIQNINL